MVGTVEVIVFPQSYEKYSAHLVEDKKVFIKGRVALEEERDGKLILESLTAFDEIPKKLWLKFPTMEDYQAKEGKMFDLIRDSEGIDSVVIYIERDRAKKILPKNHNVKADALLLEKLAAEFGDDNIRLV